METARANLDWWAAKAANGGESITAFSERKRVLNHLERLVTSLLALAAKSF